MKRCWLKSNDYGVSTLIDPVTSNFKTYGVRYAPILSISQMSTQTWVVISSLGLFLVSFYFFLQPKAQLSQLYSPCLGMSCSLFPHLLEFSPATILEGERVPSSSLHCQGKCRVKPGHSLNCGGMARSIFCLLLLITGDDFSTSAEYFI